MLCLRQNQHTNFSYTLKHKYGSWLLCAWEQQQYIKLPQIMPKTMKNKPILHDTPQKIVTLQVQAYIIGSFANANKAL